MGTESDVGQQQSSSGCWDCDTQSWMNSFSVSDRYTSRKFSIETLTTESEPVFTEKMCLNLGNVQYWKHILEVSYHQNCDPWLVRHKNPFENKILDLFFLHKCIVSDSDLLEKNWRYWEIWGWRSRKVEHISTSTILRAIKTLNQRKEQVLFNG